MTLLNCTKYLSFSISFTFNITNQILDITIHPTLVIKLPFINEWNETKKMHEKQYNFMSHEKNINFLRQIIDMKTRDKEASRRTLNTVSKNER